MVEEKQRPPRHIFREHNEEADRLANLGTEGQRQSAIEGVMNTKEWKAVRGHWDDIKEEEGWSGCGVVIKAVD